MTEQKIGAVEDDGDDVVIIGDVMPKPMTSHDQKKSKRHVEFQKSNYKKDSLIITQNVKVKKQKSLCVLRDSKVNDTRSTHDSVKKNNKCVNGSSELVDKCERYLPVCLRKTCKDSRCKVESRNGRTLERGRTNTRHHCDFPKGLKRMLSPVSSSPLEGDLSFDLEISLDTSSLQEMKESKLDTLIKRARDRDRKNQMTRTQYLFTPPHTETPNEEITGDIKTSDATDYKPPYTSTPKYEENDDKQSSIGFNNNIFQQSKSNSPSMEDIHLIFSPIKKADDVPISKSIDCKEQENRCLNSLLKDTNTQETISESVNAAASNTNFEQSTADTTVNISNNIQEQVSKVKILSIDMQIPKKSEHVQTNVSNINHEQIIFSNKITISNNSNQSMIGQRSIFEDKQIQLKTSENFQRDISDSHKQNIADTSNNNKDQTTKTVSSSLEKPQIVNKKSEYTQTVNFDVNYEENADTKMLVSKVVEPPNKSSYSELLKQHQTCDIQTIITNTEELLVNKEKMPINNNDYIPSIENPFCKEVQNKKFENLQTVSLQHNEQKFENINIPLNNKTLATIEHASRFADIQAEHKGLPDMQTAISDKNIADSGMTISCSNNNVKKQACTPNSLFEYNIQNRKIVEHMNTINSNTNYEQNIEEIDMSISYDNDDNVAEQPITPSITYEDTHLQHRQSEYYLPAVENTNHVNNNYFNHTDDFHTNYEQIVENNHMSTAYNNFVEQQNSYRNLFVSYYEQNNNFTQQTQRDSDQFNKDMHVRDIKYDTYSDINSADCNKYKQNNDDSEKPTFYNNYTRQRNRSNSPFFEDSHVQADIYYSHRKQEHNKWKKMSIFDVINFKQQQRPYFEDLNKQHKTSLETFADYSNKKYEQPSNESKYSNNFEEQQNKRYNPYSEKRQRNNIDYNYSAYSNGKQEQIRNMSYDSNRSNEHLNRPQRWYSKNHNEQQINSDYIPTSYSIKRSDQNFGNINFKEPARHRSPFSNGTHSQQKYMHNDDSRNTYEQNLEDSISSNSYKNGNFRENSSKRHSPFPNDSRHKKYKSMHTHESNKYFEQRIEERKVSTTNKNTYFEGKRNRGYNARVEDRHQYLQHRKSTYSSVFKKKVEVFIDKRMSDEAYEDVLIGLPPGRVSPDLP